MPILDDLITELDESLFVTASTLPTTFERTVIGEPNKTEVIIQDDDRKWSQSHIRTLQSDELSSNCIHTYTLYIQLMLQPQLIRSMC